MFLFRAMCLTNAIMGLSHDARQEFAARPTIVRQVAIKFWRRDAAPGRISLTHYTYLRVEPE